MKKNAKRNLAIRKALFALVLALICISLILALFHGKEWVVPEEAKKLKNPVVQSDAALRAARSFYLDNCAQCHGETGKGDGPEGMMYDPSPANLTDTKHLSTLTDGEIFYHISAGRKPMPSFKKRLTEEQRWQLVLFVRTFAAPVAALDKKPDAPASKPSSSKH